MKKLFIVAIGLVVVLGGLYLVRDRIPNQYLDMIGLGSVESTVDATIEKTSSESPKPSNVDTRFGIGNPRR